MIINNRINKIKWMWYNKIKKERQIQVEWYNII
jgi:hypothetical protein